jgi:hypothetical protein
MVDEGMRHAPPAPRRCPRLFILIILGLVSLFAFHHHLLAFLSLGAIDGAGPNWQLVPHPAGER